MNLPLSVLQQLESRHTDGSWTLFLRRLRQQQEPPSGGDDNSAAEMGRACQSRYCPYQEQQQQDGTSSSPICSFCLFEAFSSFPSPPRTVSVQLSDYPLVMHRDLREAAIVSPRPRNPAADAEIQQFLNQHSPGQ
jgi:hypothetical protein